MTKMLWFVQIVALYCQFISPIFVFPVFAKDGEITFVKFTFLEAVSRVSSFVLSVEDGPTVSLSELVAEGKRNGKCIILFPEGVRTNGDGVIEIPSQVGSIRELLVSCYGA